MSTNIRAELSKKNKWYISKHRYYELKHFCLQYHEWKDLCYGVGGSDLRRPLDISLLEWSDPTGMLAATREDYIYNIDLVERTCKDADESLAKYILKSVTEEVSFTYLETVCGIPCGRDMFYDRYRKFYWILSVRKK